MVSRSAKTAVATTVIIAGFILSFFLTEFVERARPPLPAGYEDADLAVQGSRYKGLVFGAEGLLADWYWMNSLQYMGKKISSVGVGNLDLEDLRPLNPRLLYPYLNNATDLDPKFIAPYSYGATILPAIDPLQAIALTEKGVANNPGHWRLYQYLGYIYWRLGNYEKASETYHAGSRIAGAPVFMRMMAGRMKTEGGSRDIAREIYRQIRDEAEDERSRENAELRLLQIDSLDERDLLDAVLTEYRGNTGQCPRNWGEIFPTLQRKPPPARDLKIDRSNNIVDPTGVPYAIDRENCRAELGDATRVPRK